METRRRLGAAAPPWVAAALAGSPGAAAVVHRGRDAVYVDLAGTVLGVLSAGATGVPCGLRTALPRLPDDLMAAESAMVGEGRLALGDHDVLVTRHLDLRVPRLSAGAAASVADRLEAAVGTRLDGVRAELPESALRALGRGDPEAVPALLGRGSGLTPVGDDVLCGWLAVQAGVDGGRAGGRVRDAVLRQAAARTSRLSATLLDCAGRGEVLPEFRLLLLDLADPGSHTVADRVAALLRVGHTSGAGLLLGARTALTEPPVLSALAPRSLTP